MDVQNAIDILQLAILQQLQMEVEFEDQRRNRMPKRFWVRPWLSARRGTSQIFRCTIVPKDQ